MKQKSFFYSREYLNLCYCWFLIINVSLVSSYFFVNVLEDHFDKSISTILGPIGQLIWLRRWVARLYKRIQSRTRLWTSWGSEAFWRDTCKYKGGGGCVDKKVQMQKLINKTSDVCKGCERVLFFLFFSRQRGLWLPSEPEDLTWQKNVFLSISKKRDEYLLFTSSGGSRQRVWQGWGWWGRWSQEDNRTWNMSAWDL